MRGLRLPPLERTRGHVNRPDTNERETDAFDKTQHGLGAKFGSMKARPLQYVIEKADALPAR